MPYGSDATRLRALKGNFGSAKVAGAPNNIYVALLRQATAGQEGTSLGVEPTSAGGYARVAIANVDASYTFGTVTLKNTAEIRWPAATALYSITAALNQWAIFDNSAGGEVIAFGQLTTPITVTGAGDVPVIAALGLTLTQAV